MWGRTLKEMLVLSIADQIHVNNYRPGTSQAAVPP